MRRLLLSALLVVAGVLALPVSAASAQVYPPTGSTLTLEPSLISCGNSFTATGAGWLPGATLTFTLASTPQTIGTTTVHADGTFSETFKLSSTLSVGQHTVTASGTAAGGTTQSITSTLTVRSCPSNGNSGALAFTGSDGTGWLVALAVIALLIGIGLVVAFSRRRRALSA